MNDRFNYELEQLTPKNADSKIFMLGRPSGILLNAGIEDKPLKLYGNKLLKKMKKHGFNASALRNLPRAVNDPIAIFKGSTQSSFAILTELSIDGNNVLATLEVGKSGSDISFNIITSTYGKAKEGITKWINSGKLLYENKEKALGYISTPAPIAGAGSQGLEAEASTHKYTNFSEEKTRKF